MSNKLEDVRKDLTELQLLQAQAQRQRIKDLLSIEIHKLISETIQLEQQLNTNSEPTSAAANNKTITTTAVKCYQVKLSNYAWDQSDKYLKLYVTLPKVQALNPEQVSCNWTEKSVELNVRNLENKDYVFVMKNLLEKIVPDQSYWKVKTDMVVIFAAKKEESKWSHVTSVEKKSSESHKLLPDKDDDEDSSRPEDSLMKMMKKMYDSGDDEMKRTIAKAWHEGQSKRTSEL